MFIYAQKLSKSHYRNIVPGILFYLVMFLSCDLSPNGANETPDGPLVLNVTSSSAVASITRIPDLPFYNQDDIVNIVASANSGYSFTGWSGDITSSNPSISIVMNSSKTIYANFNNSSGNQLFSLVESSFDGEVTLSPDGGVYESGTTVYAYPRPGYGFTFESWSGVVNSREELVSVVMNGNVNLKANFAIDPKVSFATLKIDPPPVHGKLVLDPPGAVSGNIYRYKPGTQVTVTAVSDSGYQLYSWIKDFSNNPVSKQSVTVTMDSNYTISATFNKAPDGVSWTLLNSGNQNGLVSIIKGGNTLVIVGNSGTILTSANGEQWSLRSSGVKNCLNSVIWTGTLFVCVGDSSTILTSPDAITWEKRYSATRDHLQSVVWTGKQFVAVGGYMENSATTYSCILTSPDGITWTKHSSISGIWYSIAWNGKIMVGGSYDYNFSTVSDNSQSYLTRSNDGINWKMAGTTIPLEVSFTSIIWTGDNFVAVGGSRSSDYFSSSYISADGDLWEANRIPTRNFINDVAWTGNNLVAVGKKGDIYYSINGSTWTKSTSGTTSDIYGVTWTGDRLYAVGYGGLLLTSP
jgi:uncharacterized repeat protein (TIGR02543 family)